MACRGCEERRRIIAEARAAGGLKGVTRAVPAVLRSIAEKPPGPFRRIVTRKPKTED